MELPEQDILLIFKATAIPPVGYCRLTGLTAQPHLPVILERYSELSD